MLIELVVRPICLYLVAIKYVKLNKNTHSKPKVLTLFYGLACF